MPELKNTRGIDYFDNVDFKQIVSYSGNPNPVCGDCLKNLLFMEDLILIPILNEVYCHKCGTNHLNTMKHFPEDDAIQKRRTNFYKNYFENGKLEY